MKNKFIVTITDIDGSRHFTLHQIVKKFLFYIVLFVLVIIAGGAWFIDNLSNEVRVLQEKKSILSKNEYELNQKSNKLQRLISEKTQQFDMLQDKIASIEEMIGLVPDESININKRLEEIKISGLTQEKLFKLVPNGPVIEYKGISAKFGWRIHPVKKTREFHSGLDLRAGIGTPIKAPADGVVEYASSFKTGYGKLIILDHSFGFQTRYAHLSKFKVENGQFVKKGQIIGYTGNTGRSTGPHLHYEVRFIGRILNPLNFFKWTRSNFRKIFEQETHVQWQSLVNLITTGKDNQETPKRVGKTQKQQ
ncbi:MAG: peptidase M24 [Proteobacteria bacterium]|nr:MAG: peptidase M24 [Pseudomonadota bacterium]